MQGGQALGDHEPAQAEPCEAEGPTLCEHCGSRLQTEVVPGKLWPQERKHSC